MPQLDLLCFFHEYIYVALCFGWLYPRLVGRVLPLYFFLLFTRSTILDIFFTKYLQLLNWYLIFDSWLISVLFFDFFTKFNFLIINHISHLLLKVSFFTLAFEALFFRSIWTSNWSSCSLISSSWDNVINDFMTV